MRRSVSILLVCWLLAAAWLIGDAVTAPGAPRKSKLTADEARLVSLVSADSTVGEIREIIRFGERWAHRFSKASHDEVAARSSAATSAIGPSARAPSRRPWNASGASTCS
jgi:hypothetical protein